MLHGIKKTYLGVKLQFSQKTIYENHKSEKTRIPNNKPPKFSKIEDILPTTSR